MASDANQNIVIEVIGELNKVVQEARESPVGKESFRRFISYLELKLRPILDQLNCGKVPELPLRVQTALDGIKAELVNFQGSLQESKRKSRLYLLTHCQEVVKGIEKTTHGIGNCLIRFSLSKTASQMRDLQMLDASKKVDDLAREMLQSQFKVSADEERICLALKREAQSVKTGNADSTVQNAILIDIGRQLGLDRDGNRGALLEQLQLLRRELVDCRDHAQIQLLETIERMFQSWTHEPAVVPHWHTNAESAADDPRTPFETFLCPLTKQVMKDPVFLESERTYERSAIKKWFISCQQQGQQPTSPVSGQTLTSTDLRPSLVLRQTINEWMHRNVGVRISQATTRLDATASGEEAKDALEDIALMAEDSAENRRKLNEAGIIPLVLELWHRNVRSGADHLRSLSMSALRCMAIGSLENKDAMVEMGAIKLAVQSLSSRTDKEKESAVGLLHEFSLSRHFCARIGSEQGAIVALIALTSTHSGGGDVEIINLAEQTLVNLEKVDGNTLQMAKAGRMKPVLTRLCQGTEETQVTLAQHLAKMILTNTSKETVAETGGKTLVRMLSISPNAREAALGALFNLSTLDDTADALIKAGVLAHLVFTIFSLPAPTNSKEIAISTLANLVLVPGNWEDSRVDRDGHFLHSKKVVHRLFGLLKSGSSLWKEKILQTLYSMAYSAQVADVVAANVRSCGGSTTLMTFVTHADTNTRLNTIRLLGLLSVHIGDDIAAALRPTVQLKYLKKVLQLPGKAMLGAHLAAATILANVPLTEFEVIRVLEVDMLQWTVIALQDSKTGQRGRLSGRTECAVQEALVGILLHFARNSNVTILNTMRELHLFTIFQQMLLADWTPLVKERSALGLQHLSQRAHLFTIRNPVQPPYQRTFFGMCLFTSKTMPGFPEKCGVHGGICNPNGTFCLVAAHAIKPLIKLLKQDDHAVREAAVSALSTLLMDNVDINQGVEELAQSDGIQPLFDQLYSIPKDQHLRAPLQEKIIWMIERILGVEEYAQGYATDQRLLKTLTEAFRHGGRANTRILAQDALALLGSQPNSSVQENNRSSGI